tara:strand:+ start:565 stop:792 length:228 start_codon:yes stop_codon:yes gene_type:complete
MILKILHMNGHGVYVWSSFVITFAIFFYLYFKTKKTLKKLEKDFVKEAESLSQLEFENLKKQKVAKEILVSHSKN